VLTHLKGIKSAPQHAIAVERACWQGEAVCAVVARTRAEAEDGCERVAVDYEPLAASPMPRPRSIRRPGHPSRARRQPHLRTRPHRRRSRQGFAEADAVVETTFVFGRHTGVTNEPRAIVADWNPGEQRLTVYHGTQAPHMMMNLFAKHLGLEEHQVRVVTKDVGGSFGIKVHTYADEMAVVALSKLLRRPVKFVADRFESFITDIHARDHRVKAKIGVRTTAPSRPGRSTTSPASAPIRSIRARRASRRIKWSTLPAGHTPARTIAPGRGSCSRTRT
jgi:carbon-monoxide dehydrogenase large subunit